MTAAAGDARSQVEQDVRGPAGSERAAHPRPGPRPGPRRRLGARGRRPRPAPDRPRRPTRYTDGTPPLSESTTTESYNGGGTVVGGVLGPENMPDAAAPTGGGDSTYDKESTTTQQRRRQDGHETVESRARARSTGSTVSVVMDDAVAGNLNQQQIRDLVGTAVGLDDARGDEHHRRRHAVRHDGRRRGRGRHGGRARGRGQREQMWSMIRTGGIAAGIALVVLLVWLRSRRRRRSRRTTSPSSSATTCSPN